GTASFFCLLVKVASDDHAHSRGKGSSGFIPPRLSSSPFVTNDQASALLSRNGPLTAGIRRQYSMPPASRYWPSPTAEYFFVPLAFSYRHSRLRCGRSSRRHRSGASSVRP